MDSNATGGDTSNEHRVYGMYADVDHTGDSDLLYGMYADTRTNHSSGQVSNLRGVYGYARADGTGLVANLHGAYNL